jgi:hypothetical protein
VKRIWQLRCTKRSRDLRNGQQTRRVFERFAQRQLATIAAICRARHQTMEDLLTALEHTQCLGKN